MALAGCSTGLEAGDDSAISPEDRELPFVFVFPRLPMRLQNDNAKARRAMGSVVFISAYSSEASAALPPDVRKGCAFQKRLISKLRLRLAAWGEAPSNLDRAYGKAEPFRRSEGKAPCHCIE